MARGPGRASPAPQAPGMGLWRISMACLVAGLSAPWDTLGSLPMRGRREGARKQDFVEFRRRGLPPSRGPLPSRERDGGARWDGRASCETLATSHLFAMLFNGRFCTSVLV